MKTQKAYKKQKSYAKFKNKDDLKIEQEKDYQQALALLESLGIHPQGYKAQNYFFGVIFGVVMAVITFCLVNYFSDDLHMSETTFQCVGAALALPVFIVVYRFFHQLADIKKNAKKIIRIYSDKSFQTNTKSPFAHHGHFNHPDNPLGAGDPDSNRYVFDRTDQISKEWRDSSTSRLNDWYDSRNNH